MDQNKMRRGYHKMAAALKAAEARAEAAEKKAETAVDEATAALREEVARATAHTLAVSSAKDQLLAGKQEVIETELTAKRSLAEALDDLHRVTADRENALTARIAELETALAAEREFSASAKARIEQAHADADARVALADEKVTAMREVLAKHEGDMKKKRYEELRAIENRKAMGAAVPGLRRG